MKIITVSGARSGVGKTTCARFISKLLPGSVCVKIGHGTIKPGIEGFFYHSGTLFSHIAAKHPGVPFLIIESNSILEEITPDFAIFLDADNPKPSAAAARLKADITRGRLVDNDTVVKICNRLEITPSIVRKIIWFCGARPEPVTGIVLAGGKSSRMGTDKTQLPINGKAMAHHCREQIAPYCDRIIFSANALNAPLFNGYDVAVDREDGLGPLMGIASGLSVSKTSVNCIVACDMPIIDPFVLSNLAVYYDDYDIVVPSFSQGTVEPLYGMYRTRTLPAIEQILAAGRRKISELFKSCKTKIVSVEMPDTYINMNTYQEYAKFVGE